MVDGQWRAKTKLLFVFWVLRILRSTEYNAGCCVAVPTGSSPYMYMMYARPFLILFVRVVVIFIFINKVLPATSLSCTEYFFCSF
jgi:hypothetical protein